MIYLLYCYYLIVPGKRSFTTQFIYWIPDQLLCMQTVTLNAGAFSMSVIRRAFIGQVKNMTGFLYWPSLTSPSHQSSLVGWLPAGESLLMYAWHLSSPRHKPLSNSLLRGQPFNYITRGNMLSVFIIKTYPLSPYQISGCSHCSLSLAEFLLLPGPVVHDCNVHAFTFPVLKLIIS